jgi:hypothetical protein
MSVIETTAGGVTTRGNGGLELQVFYRRSAKHKEAVLYEAERDPQSELKTIGGAEVTPSGANVTNKKWVQKRNEYPSGSYLRLNVRSTQPGGIVFGHTVHNILLAPRADAALHELGINLPTDANSARSKIYVIGRFDIVSPERVEELGLYKSIAGTNELATYFDIDTLDFIDDVIKEKEISIRRPAKLETVQTATGKKIMPKLVIRRRIGLPN